MCKEPLCNVTEAHCAIKVLIFGPEKALFTPVHKLYTYIHTQYTYTRALCTYVNVCAYHPLNAIVAQSKNSHFELILRFSSTM